MMMRRELDDAEEELEQLAGMGDHLDKLCDTERVQGIKPGETGFHTPTCHFCDVRALPEGLAKPELTRKAVETDAGADFGEPSSAQTAHLGVGSGSAFFSALVPPCPVVGPDAQ